MIWFWNINKKKNETHSYKATSLELRKVVDNDANEFLEFMGKKM